jgi:hypothetical protein
MYFGYGIKTDRQLILHRNSPLIGIKFTITNEGKTKREVAPALWNSLNLGPKNKVQTLTLGSNKVAVVTLDNNYALIAVPCDSTQYTVWHDDQFDLVGTWTLAPGESRTIEFYFTLGNGGQEAVNEATKALNVSK